MWWVLYLNSGRRYVPIRITTQVQPSVQNENEGHENDEEPDNGEEEGNENDEESDGGEEEGKWWYHYVRDIPIRTGTAAVFCNSIPHRFRTFRNETHQEQERLFINFYIGSWQAAGSNNDLFSESLPG